MDKIHEQLYASRDHFTRYHSACSTANHKEKLTETYCKRPSFLKKWVQSGQKLSELVFLAPFSQIRPRFGRFLSKLNYENGSRIQETLDSNSVLAILLVCLPPMF